MKRHILLLVVGWCSLHIQAQEPHSIIIKAEPGIYQLKYPSQKIIISFNQSEIPKSWNFFKPAQLDEEEQYDLVEVIKNQIDMLPSEFIQEYLDIRIYPSYIFDGKVYGYYYGNKIVVEAGKIMSDKTYGQSVTSALILELAYLIESKQHRNEDMRALRDYLEDFHENNPHFMDKENTNIYQRGFVSPESAAELDSEYSSSKEFAELFMHLICRETRDQLVHFMDRNPKSLLNEKVNHFLDYLESNIPSLSRAYFFGEPEKLDYYPQTEMKLDENQLLAAHELKSNESYDFNQISNVEDFDIASEPIPDDSELEDNTYEFYYNANAAQITDQIESLVDQEFYANPNPKKQKSKRKKKGTGLLIAGTALYIALQLMK